MTALRRAMESGASRSNMLCTAFVVVHGAVRLSFRAAGVGFGSLPVLSSSKEAYPQLLLIGHGFLGHKRRV